MIFAGVTGIIAGLLTARSLEGKSPDLKKKNQCMRDFALKLFCAFLLLIMLTNLLVFVLAGIWASDIQANVQDAWSHINETMTAYCKDVVLEPGEKCHLTPDEFVSDVQASFQLLMSVGVSTSLYMITGFVASVYVSFQDDDALLEGERLVQKHAQEYLDKLASSVRKKKRARKAKIRAAAKLSLAGKAFGGAGAGAFGGAGRLSSKTEPLVADDEEYSPNPLAMAMDDDKDDDDKDEDGDGDKPKDDGDVSDDDLDPAKAKADAKAVRTKPHLPTTTHANPQKRKVETADSNWLDLTGSSLLNCCRRRRRGSLRSRRRSRPRVPRSRRRRERRREGGRRRRR